MRMIHLCKVGIAVAAASISSSAWAADVPHCKDVIYVAVKPEVTLVNGRSVDTSMLEKTLADLKPSSRFVFYYRESSVDALSAAAQFRINQVLNAMMRLQLPISLSSKQDYSDSIDQDGSSHPRSSCPQ